MNKILIANLEEGLIPNSTESCSLLYGNESFTSLEDIIYNNLKIDLKPFLQNNNQVAIITESPEKINKIKSILKEYQELITIYQLNKELNTKEEIFNRIDTSKELYCLGSDANDIGMLKKGLQYNANTSLIFYGLLDQHFINQNSFIKLLTNEKIHELAEDEAAKRNLSYVAKVQLEKRIWLNQVDKLRKQMQEELECGTKTYNDLIKEWYLRKNIYQYQHFIEATLTKSEELNYLLSNINVYSSFNEYNTLVLRKKDTL